LTAFGANENQIQDAKKEALQWALSRGSRSGRSANQFARDWLGRSKLKDIESC
jgi:predicted AAA+ superfamily ATPase